MKLSTLLERLSPAERKTAEAVIASPIVQKALDEVYQHQEQERTTLAARRKAIPGEFAGIRKETSDRATDAMRKLEEAQKTLLKCRYEYAEASIRAQGAVAQEDRALAENERELRESADPRLADFVYYTLALVEEIKDRLTFGRLRRRSYITGRLESIEYSNHGEIADLNSGLTEAISHAKALQLEPLDRKEITKTLQALADKLAPALAAFDLSPPLVSEEEVKSPDIAGGHLRVGLQNREIQERMQEEAKRSSRQPAAIRTPGGRP